MSLEELRKGKYVLDEKQWLTVRVYMSATLSHLVFLSHADTF